MTYNVYKEHKHTSYIASFNALPL